MTQRQLRKSLAAGAAGAAVLAYALTAGAATPIPVPDPLVIVKTKSGSFERTSLVPIGGAPIPIDVDGPNPITGLLEPDIDVSVGLVVIDELPSKPVVPNVVVKRNAIAINTRRPAPPLELDAKVVLRDGANNLEQLVEIHYGFETPAGARIPPTLSAKLVGPLQGGFIDPLQAKIESRGYSGPLNLHISALTEDLDARFGLNFDSLPEAIFVSEDPREDGLDVLYQHDAPVADVHLDADASLRNRATDELLEVGANIERLPREIRLSNTNTEATTLVSYDSSSALSKPDLEATYRDIDAEGNLLTDANVKVAGLPFSMRGQFDTVAEDGERTIDKVDFEILDGEEIDSVDFLVKNFDGPAGNVPAPQLAPDQYVAVASRRQSDASTRFRAAGRLLGIRHITVERQGDANDVVDARTDMGNGIKPLRAIVDLDDRGAGAPQDAKRLKVDSLITPLPREIHAVYEPARDPEPMRLLYESSSTVDVDTDALIATGTGQGCGQVEVVCAKARVDKIPGRLEAFLPGIGGTDFSLSHDGTGSQHPDVRATVDVTDETAERVWANVAILRVPNEVTGRMDTADGVLRAAEFHACKWDFDADPPGCTDAQQALGRVTFTVRGTPDRGSLPPRPDTAKQFVTLISRSKAPAPKEFEVVGRVDEVRNVAFRQRDTIADDGEPDGTLGALVDVGSNSPEFDLVVDDVSDALDESQAPPAVIGDSITKVAVNVAELPAKFTACVRSPDEVAPPDPDSLPKDVLLAPCEKDDVIVPGAGEHAVTPLSAHYTAVDSAGAPDPAKVTANVKTTSPDLEDSDSAGNPIPATEVLNLTIDKVPAELSADVIPPITPDPGATPPVAGRRMQLAYDASDSIKTIDFGLESRRDSSICEDPRRNRKALCVSGTLEELPDQVNVSFDPDDAKGDIVMTASPPLAGEPKLSVSPFRLSKVAPEKDSTPIVLDASIEGVTDKLVGKIQSIELDGESPTGNPTLPQQLATCSDGADNDGDGKTDAADDDCEKDPARLAFNACPPDSGGNPPAGCAGIDKITFTATNSLVGDPLDPVPAAVPAVGGDQEFSFMSVGDDFRAKGLVRNLKELSYSKLDGAGAPSRVTSLRAAFGNGTPLRAFVDRDTGTESQKVDAVITDAPQAINICLRDGTNLADLKPTGGYCELRDANADGSTDSGRLALQTSLDTVATGTLPDIDLRKFEMTKGGGAEVLKASANIEDLAERIDVLVGKGEETEVLVEGRTLAGALADVARRVSFSFRNFDGPQGTSFPWGPLDGGTEPDVAVRNQDPLDGNRTNYVRVIKDRDGRVRADGSIPRVRRLALEPRPCDPGDRRFPDTNTGFAANQKPEYQCVRAIVAPDRRLGLAVRTLDEKNEILSIEEGHISKMPDSLAATLGKAPDTIKLAPVCADADNNGTTDTLPCRPPMISVEAPQNGAGGTLDARMAIGNLDLNNTLRDKQPDDPLSQRLDYEERPALSAFAKGARVKVGTEEDTGGLAMRLGLKIDIPKFLDLDPPTLYDCTHTTETPGPDCDATGVGKADNAGFESKDIFFKLVAADDKHGGNPPASNPYLGRVALMVEPITPTDGGQIVLTGMPDPDDRDPLTATETKGASSKFAEDFPAAGDPSEKGFLAPAHLDTQVFIRNDFRAVEDGKNQNSFTQLDGRVNAPLSMAVRLNERRSNDPEEAKKYVSPLNRNGTRVPPVQLTIRNAPSSNNTDSYADPTFRVRAELRDGWQDNSEPDLGEKIYTCGGEGYGIEIPALLTFCALLPVNAESRYLDLQLNADPYKPNTSNLTTQGAARRVDAVAGPFGGSNDAELRGYTTVTGNDPANITPVAALRLTNFNLGLKLGGGIGLIGGSTTYEMVGDLILGLAGHANNRTQVSSNLAAMRLISEGGTDPQDFARVITDLEAVMHFKITAEALFGLIEADIIDETTPEFHQPIEFQACSATGLLGFEFPSVDEFWTGDSNNFLFADAKPGNRKATIGFGVPSSFAGQANQFNIILSQFLQPLWCVFSTNEASMGQPAPGYTNNVRLLPGQTNTSSTETVTPDGEEPELADFSVAASTATTLCGTYDFDEVVVDGDINVGAEGATDANGRQCDGSFNLSARRITLGNAGDINASARRTTAGAGRPGGVGGGGGHHASGGRSGRDKATAGTGPGGSAYATPGGDPLADFGSAGANGDDDGAGVAPDAAVPGGTGGGTIRITAADRLILTGNAQITANGGGGAGVATRTGDACNTGGGGGSGGAIEITANIVDGDGTIEAAGGNGGASGYGGGGGSGGRIQINAIADDIPNSKTITNGGNGGGIPGSGDCHTGDPNVPFQTGDTGGSGVELTGSDIAHAANAELHPDTPGPFANGNVKVRVTGIDHADGPLEVVLCRRAVGWDDDDPFADAGLDPAGNSSVSLLQAGATCGAGRFGAHNTGAFEYVHTFDLNLSSNVYGFFAYSRRPVCTFGGNYDPSSGLCVGGSFPTAPSYTNQTPLPALATAKIGVDKGAPQTSPITARDGEAGCPSATAGDSLCLTANSGSIDVNWADNESGVTAVQCRVNGGEYGDCKARPTTLTLPSEGENIVDVRVFDQAGNVSEVLGAVEWFVDTHKPNTPTVTVSPQGSENNGWYNTKPLVSVSASDPNPSSGFDTTPISLFVDEAEVECGGAAAGSTSTSGSTGTSCGSGSVAADVPADGIHTFTAHAVDRVGHKSDTADPETMRVDATPPKSRFFIGPKLPDGAGGWYVTKPFVAFAASDRAGGSGVDSSLDSDDIGAGIHFSIDGGAFQEYDPENAPVLGDGVHEVCFFARDLADNREDADGDPGNGNQSNCVSGIRVDTTAPNVHDPIDPVLPDGDNSFYRQTPTVDGSGDDPLPVSVNSRSGLERVELQIDDGDWTTAGPTPVAEGEHVVRTRAFDNAGNPSQILERVVRVDKTDPAAVLASYPPAPNDQGWFRRPIVDSIAAFDGRDGSGADGATFKVDAVGPNAYLQPFDVTDGVHSVSVRARDFAGRQGAEVQRTQRVDTVAPVGTPTGQPGNIYVSILGIPSSTTLSFTATDALSPRVRVQVLVYNELGYMVRRLTVPGPHLGGYRDGGAGSVAWDGRTQNDEGVAPGVYHYRVLVVDQAGNTVLGPESKTFLVVLGLLPRSANRDTTAGTLGSPAPDTAPPDSAGAVELAVPAPAVVTGAAGGSKPTARPTVARRSRCVKPRRGAARAKQRAYAKCKRAAAKRKRAAAKRKLAAANRSRR